MLLARPGGWCRSAQAANFCAWRAATTLTVRHRATPRQVTGLYFFWPELLTEWSAPTLKYAPWVAVILAAANLAIIEALAGIPASAGSTVYRLNSVGVVLGGWLLLGEPLGGLKLGGVSAGVVAVLLMYAAGRSTAQGIPATTNRARAAALLHHVLLTHGLRAACRALLSASCGSVTTRGTTHHLRACHSPLARRATGRRAEVASRCSGWRRRPMRPRPREARRVRPRRRQGTCLPPPPRLSGPAHRPRAPPTTTASRWSPRRCARPTGCSPSRRCSRAPTRPNSSSAVPHTPPPPPLHGLQPPLHAATASVTWRHRLRYLDGTSVPYGCSLCYPWLQPLFPMVAGAAGWCLVGAAYAMVRERSLWGWRKPACLRYGSINGMLQMGNIGLLNLALMQGSASILVPAARRHPPRSCRAHPRCLRLQPPLPTVAASVYLRLQVPVANCSFAMMLTLSVLRSDPTHPETPHRSSKP